MRISNFCSFSIVRAGIHFLVDNQAITLKDLFGPRWRNVEKERGERERGEETEGRKA
jgi:hypothetical protein